MQQSLVKIRVEVQKKKLIRKRFALVCRAWWTWFGYKSETKNVIHNFVIYMISGRIYITHIRVCICEYITYICGTYVYHMYLIYIYLLESIYLNGLRGVLIFLIDTKLIDV